MTLKADKEYLVTNNLIFMSDAILTIEPGATFTFSDQTSLTMQENSKMIANGTKDSIITLTSETDRWAGIKFPSQVRSELSFANVEYISLLGGSGGAIFDSASDNIDVENVLFRDNNTYRFASGGPSYTGQPKSGFNKVNIDENYFSTTVFWFRTSPTWYTTRFDDINITNTRSGSLILFNETDFATISDMKINVIIRSLPLDTNELYTFRSYGNDIVQNVKAYPGTADIDIINSHIWDAYNNSQTSSVIDRTFFNSVPYEGAHGIVWKVLVNGFDARDEYALIDPIGVGTHEIKVYFNRQMDTSVNPQISYGVTIPYTQNIIDEEGSWSDDGKTYSVNHNIKIGANDGINRIRVSGARDLDLFEIPVEASRFNMNVQSAGSASTGFAATPGLGEVSLEWTSPNESDLSDILGYNMYRYEAITDTTYTDTIKINKALITDINYKDYDVVRKIIILL